MNGHSVQPTKPPVAKEPIKDQAGNPVVQPAAAPPQIRFSGTRYTASGAAVLVGLPPLTSYDSAASTATDYYSYYYPYAGDATGQPQVLGFCWGDGRLNGRRYLRYGTDPHRRHRHLHRK